jgi:5-deoxy-D-glucuronate isomerase
VDSITPLILVVGEACAMLAAENEGDSIIPVILAAGRTQGGERGVDFYPPHSHDRECPDPDKGYPLEQFFSNPAKGFYINYQSVSLDGFLLEFTRVRRDGLAENEADSIIPLL